MTPKRVRTYLADARRSGEYICEIIAGKTFETYAADRMLRRTVEREFEIIGEALNRVRRIDVAVAAAIPDLAKIVAFRNLLSHDYAEVNDWFFWLTARSRVPELLEALAAVQAQLGED